MADARSYSFHNIGSTSIHPSKYINYSDIYFHQLNSLISNKICKSRQVRRGFYTKEILFYIQKQATHSQQQQQLYKHTFLPQAYNTTTTKTNTNPHASTCSQSNIYITFKYIYIYTNIYI